MATKQGDVSLFNEPIAQELLKSATPARLAYVSRDGRPRVPEYAQAAERYFGAAQGNASVAIEAAMSGR